MFWPFAKKERIAVVAPRPSFTELKKRVKIVVVDDDPNSFPTTSLQEDGYTVEPWDSLTPARLQRLENGAFDIIVLDILGIADSTLSDTGDGLGVLKRLKTVNPNQTVVAFSGSAYDLSKVPFWKLADDALQKPVSQIKAKELLDHLIKEHVSISRYWSAIEALLKKEGVGERQIRKLETEIIQAGRSRQGMSAESVRRIIGAIASLNTVTALADKLLTLWQAYKR